MSVNKCRTASLFSTNNEQGLALIKKLECHNRECKHCRRKLAQKHYKLMSSPIPMLLYYNVVSEKEAKSISLSARRSGGFYWSCSQGNGMSVVVSSDGDMVHTPIPVNRDAAETLIDSWIAECPKGKRISHTRSSVPEKKKKSSGGKWNNIIKGIPTEEIKSIIEMVGYEDIGNGMFKKTDGKVPVEDIKIDAEYNNVHLEALNTLYASK